MTEDKNEAIKENAHDILGSYSQSSLGGILKKTRQGFGLSLSQVHDAIRIKQIYLEALEDEDFDRLPGRVYVTGFVKAYSEYLGLDSDQMIQLLKKKTGVSPQRPVYHFPVASNEQKIPGIKIILASFAALVVILLAWGIASNDPKSEEIPPVPPELAEQMKVPDKPVETKSGEAALALTETAKPKPHPVVMKAVEDVWLEIKDGAGKPLFSRVLKAGEEYWVPADANDYAMTTGNAGGLQIVVEGVAMEPMGGTGEVKRNVALNPAALKVMLSPISVPTEPSGKPANDASSQ